MGDQDIQPQEMPFLMGGKQEIRRPVQIRIGAKIFSDANSLMQAVRATFTEQECAEVLAQLESTGALTASEIAGAKQKAGAFPSLVTEPTVQRAATIAIGMAARNGSLPAAKYAELVRIANQLDQIDLFALADRIDAILEEDF